MAPPRHHQGQQNHHHGVGGGGNSGSPFPPLGMAASGMLSSAAGPNGNTASSTGSSHSYHHDPGSSGLPPAPSKLDTTQAQTYRLQDAYWSDDEEDMDCPLCLEEIDISDANFKPCPCGYQICRFCWHHIKSNLNGRCPACRRKYSDTTVEFKPMSQDEIKKLSQAKKQKEREKRELESMNRKHLANMRVVQKNLVYVVGMDPKLAREELIPTLRSQEYFGQYGRISKILISKRTTASKLIMGTQESAIGVYVTYVRKEDAARAIIAIDGSKSQDGRTIRASYGTTKYCTTYLRNLQCNNPICTYLHEPGEEADSFTKEDLTTLRHAAKDTESRNRPPPAPGSFGHAPISSATSAQTQQAAAASPGPVPSLTAPGADSSESSALPKTVSWATQKMGGTGLASPAATPSGGAFTNAIRDQDLPPLSALAVATSQRKQQQQQQQTVRAPQSPAASKVVSATQRSRGRPTTPTSNSAESPVPPTMETGSPAPIPPPGLVRRPSGADTGHSSSMGREDGAAAPPALSKIGAPPGLSRSATPTQESPRSSPTAANRAKAYQPSSNAQAVLDDMRSRRSAAESHPTKSPFPDFDKTLSSFNDGEDFSFNFEESLLPAHLRGPTSSQSSLGPFAPFAFGQAQASGSLGPSHGSSATKSQSTFTPPPPGLGGVSVSNATEPPTYSGRFDPFAPGAGEKLIDDPGESAPSPFATIEQMRRTLSEDRSPPGLGSSDAMANGEEEGSASRFGFAKQQTKDSFKTSDDLLGFIRSGANINAMSNGTGAGVGNGQHFNGGLRGTDDYSRGSLSQGGLGSDWRSGSQLVGQRDSPLAGILPLNTNQSSYNMGSNYIADQGYFGASTMGRNSALGGADMSNGRQDSLLLAQLMNRRPNDMTSTGSNGVMPPFQDSAIMSYNQQQRQQSSQSPFASRFGEMSGGGSTSSPIGNSGMSNVSPYQQYGNARQ